jgi:hypothetical protein
MKVFIACTVAGVGSFPRRQAARRFESCRKYTSVSGSFDGFHVVTKPRISRPVVDADAAEGQPPPRTRAGLVATEVREAR